MPSKTEKAPEGTSFAGMINGKFIGNPPGWVDKEKAPGQTSQTLAGYGTEGYFGTVLKNYANLSFMFFSPNLVWFAVALGTYLAFPYDFEAAAVWDRGFVLGRCALHTGIMPVTILQRTFVD